MKKVWIAIHSHSHGIDVWPIFNREQAKTNVVIEQLTSSGDWKDGENDFVEVRGPFVIHNDED